MIGTCSGLAVPTGSIIKIVSQMLIFGLNVNNEWQYNQAGVNLGTDWLNNSYNDHDRCAGQPAMPSSRATATTSSRPSMANRLTRSWP